MQGEASPEDPARTIAELREQVAGLRAALATRGVIEQATGIVIATTGLPPEEAFAVLVTQSQHENRKLREVAADLVDSKVRR